MKYIFAPHVGRLALCLCLLLAVQAAALAQAGNDEQDRVRAFQLIKEQKFTEALPLLEKLSQTLPKDPDVQFYLGFALLGQSTHAADQAEAKALRARARKAFVRAKELGSDAAQLQGLIDGIPQDGGSDPGYSKNSEAEKLMAEGERAFSSGRL